MRPSLTTFACALALALAAAPASASPGADGLERALARGAVSHAEYALARASALFHPDAVRARFPGTRLPDSHAATLVLRDLRAALPDLEPAARAAAARILARPTDPNADGSAQGYRGSPARVDCGANVCVHWVEATPDAPPLVDEDTSGVPDWVETTRRTFEHAWAYEVGVLGYRPPLSDYGSLANGGDARLDVYLADIGDRGYFGYCTTDDPAARVVLEVSAYCVVDDDFANSGFGGRSPLHALEATAAHELFHAIQFAYDWLEDAWLMEGTAAWIEDEVFDALDDNRTFLHASPLAQPEVALDDGRRGHEYGAWIFWRFLSERFGAPIVREVWERAALGGDGGTYSLEAVSAAVAARGSPFASAFVAFAVANRTPGTAYEEGAAYPAARSVMSFALSRARPVVERRRLRVARLAGASVSFRLGRARSRALRIRIAGAGDATDLVVSALVVRPSGAVRVRPVSLGADGSASVAIPLRRSRVSRVDLVAANASTALACWRGTALSCRGVPLATSVELAYRAELVR
ncbi:MAG TPA: MXAN_6640 family putative metalloprotease [Gaiellaceae bacterium]|nr:MXAN_6640 family putative metalloprotease [Gaiellaceae bacterium]